MSLSSFIKHIHDMPRETTLPPPKFCEEYNINENDNGCILGTGDFGVVTRERCAFKKIKCKGEYVAKKTLMEYNPTEVLAARQEKLVYEQLSQNPSVYVLSMYGSVIDEKNKKITQYFQYIGGEELFYYREKRFIRNIVIGLIKGLKHIHDQNVIHGDIKPENIIIDTSKEPHCPVYIDFAGSVLTPNKDEEGVLTSEGLENAMPVVTHEYQIEEEREGDYITARTDVYALLITFINIPIKYNKRDTESAVVKELRHLQILHYFELIWNDGDVFYEYIWKNWMSIIKKVKKIRSPQYVPVNNINHNNPPSFYTMPIKTAINLLHKTKSRFNRQVSKIKNAITPQYIQEKNRQKIERNERIIELQKKDMEDMQYNEANRQRRMENELDEEAEAKETSNRNSNIFRISTTPVAMNGYLGGVSKNKFRKLSKKTGKIRNRRKSTKKRRSTKKRN